MSYPPADWPMWDAIAWKCPYCAAATTDIDMHAKSHRKDDDGDDR